MEKLLTIFATNIPLVPCDGCPDNLFDVFRNFSNIVLGFIGIIAVVMLVVGGIRYMVSGGDSKKITDAKNTVLYAIIGLIICLLSAVIVNTVITVIPVGNNTTENTASIVSSTCAA